MTEVVLLGVIVALISLIAFMDWNNRKERKSLLNAIKSKDVQDMVNLELADKTKIDLPTEPQPDIVPTETLTDQEYEDLITGNGK